jgi:hypothetical protein
MKVIYNTCYADPWINVALKLHQNYGYIPLYWIGYEDDDSANIVPQVFPRAIYHPYYDACKGIFPKDISEKFINSYINVDFLKNYATYELQAIRMMDRMDSDRYSFNFMERQRHFRNLIKSWTACIDLLKPDLVISAVVPHRVYDYVLYLVCQYNNIKYISYRGTAFLGRIIPLRHVYSIGNILDEDYIRKMESGLDIESLKKQLPEDIFERYTKVQLDYSKGQPYFVEQQEQVHIKSSSFWKLSIKFIIDLYTYRVRYFGKDGFFRKGIPTYNKRRNQNLIDSHFSLIAYSKSKYRNNIYKKKLKQHYNSLVVEPDLQLPYVIFNLHYQPEMTTSPSGDIFVDQRLCVEILAKHLPSSYYIYIKEHPAQFHSHREGHTSRLFDFYNDLISYPQVRLIPLNYDPFILIKYAKVVATVTGTIGWEGIVFGKPVLIFGLSWYEKYAGVLKIENETSAAMIPQFIEHFKFNEENLLAYLIAFGKKSIVAYYYRGLKMKMTQSEDECVRNIAESIIQMSSE